MADSDFAAVRAVIADTAADWAPDAERRTLDWFDALVAEVERLRAAVVWMLTEMPVGWEEVARGEDRRDVVDTALAVRASNEEAGDA